MTYIKDIIETGGRFEGPLLVKTADKGIATNGVEYFNINFQDVTGTLNGKKWTVESGDSDLLKPGSIVNVTGNVFQYRGHPQLKVEDVFEASEDDYDPADFYLSCPIKDEELFKDLDDMIALIEDEDIKKLTKAIIDENKEKYMTYPAAVSVHHAYRCGIVYHSLCICKMALDVSKNYPQLNRDYLIAGSLIHDIGKTREMNGIVASSYTFEGNLLGHISIGTAIIMETGERIGTPKDKVTILAHMILSHHGKPEYGSAVIPQTPEAYVLHILDDLDSKMNILDNALSSVKVGNFSQRIPYMEGKAFLKTK
ncbi:MAG: HD domain-containing protein [Bacilli bacterium]